MKNPGKRALAAFVALLSATLLALCGCAGTQQAPAQEDEQVYPALVVTKGQDEQNEALILPGSTYRLADTRTVDGRQGIAWADGAYFVSGSTTLSRYDAAWSLEKTNDDPFANIDTQVNHLGDIDAYDGKIYAGVENFVDGEASNIQIVVYDAETLEPLEAFPFEPESGQTEVSGIAVDPDHGSVWMCSRADGESGRYLYRYNLDSGDYLGKVHLQAPPQWIQGVAYHDGWLYITADDGTADDGDPDHVWRCKVDLSRSAWHVSLERTLDDVALPGEVEGISFGESSGQMLVSHNRGAHIVLGMPKGFYEGYDEEVHEVYVYDAEPASAASATSAPTAGVAAPASSVADAEAGPDGQKGFYMTEITDDIFDRIKGKSFKDDCTLPREDLRYLHVLHKDASGAVHEGEIIVNRHIADDVLDILQQLYESGYPIEKIRLVDEYDADDELSMEDNNSSSFNFRFISHTTRVSKHGLGLAVDINTLYNPYTKVVDGERIVEPVTGESYLDRSASFDYKIEQGDLCYNLFIEHGFEWGGEWTDRKDYQHFEVPDEKIVEWYPENAA